MPFTEIDETLIKGIYKLRLKGTPKLIGRVKVTVKLDIALVTREEEEMETYELNNSLEMVVNVKTAVSIMESVEVLVEMLRTY